MQPIMSVAARRVFFILVDYVIMYLRIKVFKVVVPEVQADIGKEDTSTFDRLVKDSVGSHE